MSRKIFKKILFLLMFSGAILGMYSFFSGMTESDKRSGAWKGLVNNMYIGSDGQKGPVQSHDNHHVQKGRPSFGDILAQQQQNKAQVEENEDDNPVLDRRPVNLGDFGVPQDVRHDDGRGEEKPGRNAAVESKVEDIDVKDESGNVIGQKLFAFGMSKDDLLRHKDRVNLKGIAVDDNNAIDKNEFDKTVEIQREKYSNGEEIVGGNEGEENVDNDGNDNNVENDDAIYGADEENRAPENEIATERPEPDHDMGEEGEIEGEEDDFSDIRQEQVRQQNQNDVYRGDEMVDNREEEKNNVANVVRPDAAVRDENGQIVGQKLYPFGMRPGANPQDDFLSSRKLQQDEPRRPVIEARQVKNVRPDAAFFDDEGKMKKGDTEMDRMSDFQQRMGLKNPLMKHNFNFNDPHHKHHALFRPLGANGWNPMLDDKQDDKDDDSVDPNDAFAGLDHDKVWGNIDDSLFKIHHPKPVKEEIDTGHKNMPGMVGGHPSAGPQQQHGQFLGHGGGDGYENNQVGNLNKAGMSNRNLPNILGANEHRQFGNQDRSNNNNILPNQQLGGLMGKQVPQQGVQGGQLLGRNFGQNQFGAQNGVFNNPNTVGRQQQLMGLNRNNNYNRFPLTNGFNNQNAMQNNAAFGNVNANPNQFANGFGQQGQFMGKLGQPLSNQMFPPQQDGQMMGLNGNGAAVAGQQWGQAPNLNQNLNQNQNQFGAVTPFQRKVEQQIVRPMVTKARPLPLIKENVEVENTNEEEEELFIEDLTEELKMIADCVPFPFPSGEASLCVPKMGEADEQEVVRTLEQAGTWDPDSLKQMSEVLVSDPTIGVIDVGAGIGVYSIAAALMGRHVVAVEPLYINYRLLHKTALANHVAEKIVMVVQALDKESYIGHMAYSRDSGEFNKVRIEHLAEEDITKDRANNVHVTTLNQLVKAIPFKRALLKIDVGGTVEADILDAGSKFFSSLDIPYILTHWNDAIDLNKKIQITSKLATMGYSPRRHWGGVKLDPNSLRSSMDFLVWQKG